MQEINKVESHNNNIIEQDFKKEAEIDDSKSQDNLNNK